MGIGDGTGPVGEDVGHVFPLDEGAGKCVEEAFLWLVDFGDAEDIVDVAYDGEAGGGNEVGSCIANFAALGVDVETLDVGSCVAVFETVSFDLNKGIEVALVCCGVGKLYPLIPTIGCDCSTSSLFSGCASRWSRFNFKSDIHIILLEDKD